MKTVAGIFGSRADAERATEHLRSAGIAEQHLGLLAPGTPEEEAEEALKAAETEHPGTGEKVGGAVGRGLGIASGIMIGGAVGSFLVPGVGAVFAAGILGATLLGTGGAALGAAAGSALDEVTAKGLPHDDLHVYEDALRQGRAVVVAVAKDEEQAGTAREQLEQAGAESLEDARERWWTGLRGAEGKEYAKQGGDFAADEPLFRRGFEAALHPRRRGKEFGEAAESLRGRYGDDYRKDAFRRGYERGQTHYQDFLREFHPEGKGDVPPTGPSA